MEFKELIEARRSVRKYAASEIAAAIVGEALNVSQEEKVWLRRT